MYEGCRVYREDVWQACRTDGRPLDKDDCSAHGGKPCVWAGGGLWALCYIIGVRIYIKVIFS